MLFYSLTNLIKEVFSELFIFTIYIPEEKELKSIS